LTPIWPKHQLIFGSGTTAGKYKNLIHPLHYVYTLKPLVIFELNQRKLDIQIKLTLRRHPIYTKYYKKEVF